MPTCSICNLEKERDAFRQDSRRKNGVRAECIDCQAELERRRKPPTIVDSLVSAQEQPRLPSLPEQRLTMAIDLRMQFYQCSGLDALYDLAMMPMSENSGLMQVKYLAATRLAGAPPEKGASPAGTTAFDETLKTLSEAFHQKAPKLREIRERVATFDDGSQERSVVAG